MTNKLEKQFFDTFGIEPSKKQESELVAIGENIRGLKIVEKPFYGYPQITDRILLELIIILGTICTVFDKNVDDLKEHVLKNLIELNKRYLIYNQVRTLFKAGQCLKK